jgi:hypothetical protein
MQQFTVPQFIDVEDKIIGPITARQFIIMLTGFLFIGISYKIFDFSGFLIVGIMIFCVSGIFAFFKINGMPFHFFVLNFIETAKKPRLRVWNNSFGKEKIFEDDAENAAAPARRIKQERTFSQSRLNELALIVDSKGSYRGED